MKLVKSLCFYITFLLLFMVISNVQAEDKNDKYEKNAIRERFIRSSINVSSIAEKNSPRFELEGLVFWQDVLDDKNLTKAGTTGAPFSEANINNITQKKLGGIKGSIFYPIDEYIDDSFVKLSAYFILPQASEKNYDIDNTEDTDMFFINIGDTYDVSQEIDELNTTSEIKFFGGDIDYYSSIMSDKSDIQANWYGGMKFINLEESLDLDISNTLGRDEINFKTTNRLVGPQIGLDSKIRVGEGIYIGLNSSVGLLWNFYNSEFDASLSNGAGTTNIAKSVNDSRFAQSVELSPSFNMEIDESLAFTLSGSVLWLNNIAKPSSMINENILDNSQNDDLLNSKEDKIFYNIRAGIEIDLQGL